jgi:hypothetical protein
LTRYRVGLVLALAIGVGLGGALAVQALGRDSRLNLCPVSGNRVLATFEIQKARDYARVIPRMLRSPELEVDSPAFVVLFDGPASLTVHGAPPANNAPRGESRPVVQKFDGVVCVVVDGSATIYSDVDISGWAKP